MDATRKNRFIGSRSYEEQDKEIFFGRSQEARELIQLIKINSFTSFYGRSGLGKTSLLKAGVFPELQRNNFLPLYFRFNYTDESKDYVKQIEDVLFGKDETVPIDPVYHVSKIEKKETLWEFFHHYPIKNRETGIAVIPLFVFDQFEEIFTLGTKEKSGEFRENVQHLIAFLCDLIENSPPDSIPEENQMKLRFQFANVPMPVKILFSFREEYLSNFYSLSSIIPSIAYSNLQYRLYPLNFDKGYSIIHEASHDLFEEEAIGETLRVITESHNLEEAKQRDVDSFLLSIFCESRVDELVEGKKVNKEDVSKVDIQKLVNSLYQNIMDELQLNKEEKMFIEDKLITTEGFRLPVYLAVAEAIPNLRIPKIEELERKNVLKRYILDGKPCIEIIHDKYAAAVKTQRDFRLNAEKETLKLIKDKEELQRKAQLTNIEKEKIELELKKAAEEKRISIIEANLAHKNLKRERKIKKIMVIALFFFIAMGIFAGYSFNQSQNNLKKADLANRELSKAMRATDSLYVQLQTQRDTLSFNSRKILIMNTVLSEQINLTKKQKQEAIKNEQLAIVQNEVIKKYAESLNVEQSKVFKLNEELQAAIEATKDTLSTQKKINRTSEKLGYLIASARNFKVKNPAIAYLLIKSAKKMDPLKKEVVTLFDSLSNQTGYFESRFMEGQQTSFLPDGRILMYDDNNSIFICDLEGNNTTPFPKSKSIDRVILSTDGKQALTLTQSNVSLLSLESDVYKPKVTKSVKNISHVSFLNNDAGFYAIEKNFIKIWNRDGLIIRNIKLPDNISSIRSVSADSAYLCVDSDKGITIFNLDSLRTSVLEFKNNEQNLAFLIPNKNQFISIQKNIVYVRNFQGKVLEKFTIQDYKSGNYNNVFVTFANNGTKALLKYYNNSIPTINQKLPQIQQSKYIAEKIAITKEEVIEYVIDLINNKSYLINKFPIKDKLAFDGSINSGFFSDDGNYFLGNFKDIDFGNTMYVWNVSEREWILDGKITVFDENLAERRFLKFGNDKFILTSAPKSFLANKEINTVLWIHGKANELDERGKLPKLSEEELYSIAGITINDQQQFKY